ncbi:treslin-like [Patiria miniata]|uniref:Treslin n=1 Tax=Patiria miniata TaxID=46514 RepID=A0A914BSY8_PATMI|nr:treslin-like [Patiria miniata]
MATEDRHFKVAFLIDARRRITPTDKPIEVDTFSRGVRLCVLKLLSYFTHVRDDSQRAIANLRWGFKVFHSYDYPPCKRDYLKQLSLKNFQDFEDQLSGDLEGLALSVRGKRAPKTPQVLTATSLRQALDDVIHDFQWDGPDVCSPVKRSAAPSPRKASRSQGSNLLSKCVFLMMPCPVSRSGLEEFCDFGPDDPLPRTSEFLEMILPASGSQQIFQDQKIALFWIDTSPWIATEKRDQDGLSVVAPAMQELGGCVIPIHALVSQTEHITTSLKSEHPINRPSETPGSKAVQEENDSSSSLVVSSLGTGKLHSGQCPSKPKDRRKTCSEGCIQDNKSGSSSFLPFSAVVDHYVNSEKTVTSGRGSYVNLKLSAVTDGQATDLCCLELNHLTGRPLTPAEAKCASPLNKTASSPKDPPTDLTITATNWCRTFSVTNLDAKSEVTSPVETVGSPSTRTPRKCGAENQAVVKAKLSIGTVPISQYQDNAVYTCTGLALDATSAEGNTDVRLSSWFKEAMVSLSRQRKALLVDMPHPETGTPVMAVLEPLTATTASLRMLKSWPLPGQSTTNHRDEASRARRASSRRRSGTEDAGTRIRRIAEECVRRRSGMEKTLRNTQGGQQSPHPTSSPSSPCEMVSFRPHLLEPWFSYCPSGGASARLIDKLQSVPLYDKPPGPTNPTLPSQLLQQLGERYSRQPGTVSSQNIDMKVTGQADIKAETQARQSAAGLEGQVRQSPRLKKRKSTMNVGFRTERIMSNSRLIQTTKEPSPVKKNQKENRVPGNTRNKTSTFKCPTFESEQDVIDCIQAAYEKEVTEGSCAMDFVQFTTSIVLSYMKSGCTEAAENDPVTGARDLLTSCLLVSSNQLRDKYQSQTDEASKLLRVQEIELQVLLRLEMEAMSPTAVTPGKGGDGKGDEEKQERGGDSSAEEEGAELPENVQKLVDEIVKLLRAIPFLADPNRLTSFLAETLLQNYAESLPHVLRAIYDDLMQPVPSILLSPSSDVTLSSVKTQPPPSYRSSSHGSFAEPSVSSTRTQRSLVRHPSLADMGSKRVIPVPSRNVAKKKDKSKPKDKEGKEKSKLKESKEEGASSAKTVRRNLFMGGAKHSPRKGGSSKLQRRQSVAVMQNIHGTRKSPRRRTPQKTKAPLVLKTKVVKETPGKKQVLQAMLKKQERARRISASSGDAVVPPTPMRVIEESPLKPVQELNVRRSPRIKPHKPGDRRSFYSTSSITDLKRARDLGSRIAGKVTPPPSNKPLKPSSRKSLLSEICSPGSMPGISVKTSESPSRNTRSQVGRTPSKDPPGKVDPVGISPDGIGQKDDMVFKTPTRAPRRINFKSPPKHTTAVIDSSSGAPSESVIPIKDCGQVGAATQVPVVAGKLSNGDQVNSPSRRGLSPSSRATRQSGCRALSSPTRTEAGLPLPAVKIPSPSPTPKRQGSLTTALSMTATAMKEPSEHSTSPKQSQTDGENVVTPGRRSQRLLKSPAACISKQAEIYDKLTQPPVIIDTVDAKDKSFRSSLTTQDNSLQLPRSRKRTLADRSPSPNPTSVVSTPSPQKSTKSVTPSSLQKWQRRKKLRRDSPEKSNSPIFPKVTPPSAKGKSRTATPSPPKSPKFGRVTPYSEKRKRAPNLRTSAKKENLESVVPEESLGKARQYKLGKVCKANVNLLTLMTDEDDTNVSQMQTRSQSRESANSEGTAKDLTEPLAEPQVEAYTFLDTHLDDSDDDIDFPRIISPLRPKAGATSSDKVSPNGVGKHAAASRSPEMSARSSASVFLSEDEASISTDDVFLLSSPSRAKRKLITTPLTTGGLFELINSPMLASVNKTEKSGSRVSFIQPRKGGRQLYPSGSQSSLGSPGHTMARRSSSLGLKRLSSDSP